MTCCILFCTPLFSWSGVQICGVVCMRYCDIFAALNAIPVFVFLNKLVIFLILGLWYVSVVQILRFFSLGCEWVGSCCVCRLRFWSRCFGKLLFLAMSCMVSYYFCFVLI